MKKLFVLPALAIALSLAACGGGENKSATTVAEETPTEETTSTETVPGVENLEVSNTIVIEGNDQMKFNKELFRVKAGEDIELTLTNVGSLPKEQMGHNLVVLNPGVDVMTFGGEATSAADSDYIPKTSLSSIAAHTKLLGPGESDKISFKLDKGVYTFICSFPGHFGMMQGKIVAE